jgi:hypothetical protein
MPSRTSRAIEWDKDFKWVALAVGGWCSPSVANFGGEVV